MRQKRRIGFSGTAILACVMCMLISIGLMPSVAYAHESSIAIDGKVYTFGEKDHYEYENAKFAKASPTNTYGRFTLSGYLSADGNKEGIPSYVSSADKVFMTYLFDEPLPDADESTWHLFDDKSKTIAGITLDGNINKGAIILQTSKDGKKWFNDYKRTNVFSEASSQGEAFYSTNSIQLAGGCYYRLIVAYETCRKIGQNQLLFIKTDKMEYQKTAEVYEFYLHSTSQSTTENTKTKSLGSLVNTGKDNGYSGAAPIDIKDPHYGWKIGDFFVSGYTRDTKDDDGTPVFLKNVGDQITLWFNLKQDINQLNDDPILSISEDTNGYDQYFQTAKTNMGRGALIIRYTDEKGIPHEPEIYTNYLAANTATKADTVVRLFEEGDYEVALDYEIKKASRKVGSIEVVPEYKNYRISFAFKVRNGNCMVYPFDIATNDELTDEAITPNGFRLDMAKSRYLNIDVTRAEVSLGANGYTEDIRFNRPAKDGDQYTDDGIYTFRVKNLYTGESTSKTIYVGTVDYLKALSVNKITVAELNEQLGQGATIEGNGTLSKALPEQNTAVPDLSNEQTDEPNEESEVLETPMEEPELSESVNEPSEAVDAALTQEDLIEADNPEESPNRTPIVIAVVGGILVVGVAAVVLLKKKKKA